MIRQAERVEQMVKRLQVAIYQHDEIVARALIDRTEIEARFAAMLARGLREGSLCA
ncbi:hypothetical protein ACRBEV_23495 [Methylobacterium phyllosphaerae]